MSIKRLYDKAINSLRRKDYPEAIKYFDLLIGLDPNNADAYSERGVSKLHVQDLDGALFDINKSLELEPQNAYRYASRAFIKAKMEDTEGAIIDYKRAIELDPENAVSHNNLGLLEEKLGYMDQSKTRFKLADKISEIENKDPKGQHTRNPDLVVNQLLEELNIHVEKDQKHNLSIWTYILAVFTSKKYRNDYFLYLRKLFSRLRK